MLASIRAFFARDDDPYAGGDRAMARQLGSGFSLIALGVTIALLPIAPPDKALGDWGWVAFGALMVLVMLPTAYIARRDVSWDFMLGASYSRIAQIAVLQWLAGGYAAPYHEIYLVITLYAGAVHPPRRVAGVLAAVALALVAPLLYAPVTPEVVAQVAIRILLYSALAFLASALMKSVRQQRLGLQNQSARAERLARHDELTGLPNRRAFVETLAKEVSRVRRTGAPLSVVVADLDDFKGINDVHGHPAGDTCLVVVAGALRSTLRQYDSCFRWGGDEFTLVLPETSLADAEIVCDRLSQAVLAGCRAPDGTALHITCAPAQLDETMTGEDLVARADEALLTRKRRGGLRLAQTG